MPTAAADHEQQGTALRITLAEDGSEPAKCLGPAQDPGSLYVRGEPVAQAASRSSAPISTAARASAAARTTHLFKRCRMSSDATYRSQGFQMLGARIHWRKKQKDEIDRLTID